MPLDPRAREYLNQNASKPPIETLPVDKARRFAASTVWVSAPGVPIASVEETEIEGVPVRIYIPEAERPLPVLVYFHGGGWVTGNLDLVDSPLRILAKETPCVVISVDYRLAPEHPFPAPLDDCYAVTEWVAANALSLGADPARLAVGGDSAGGNLAAAVALRARRLTAFDIGLQVLIYPVTDNNLDTPSYLAYSEGYGLTREGMRWFWHHYLPEGNDALACVLGAPDLSELPPALVILAEFDVLFDEGKAYADRLREAGVTTDLMICEGMIHGFFRMTGVLDKANQVLEETAKHMRRALRSTGCR
ncbi:MAG: alpha/beta hydrolase [Actinobacteria bacterium]|nr:alpha/beta hydrolase [Actinomycetota bacterium]